jgi:hypothetical protein
MHGQNLWRVAKTSRMRDHDQTNPPAQRQALPGRRPFSQNTPGHSKDPGPGITDLHLLLQKGFTAKRKASKTIAHKEAEINGHNKPNTHKT